MSRLMFLHIGGPLDGKWESRPEDAKTICWNDPICDRHSVTVSATAAAEDECEGEDSFQVHMYSRVDLGMAGPDGKVMITVFAAEPVDRGVISRDVWGKMLGPVLQYPPPPFVARPLRES